VHLDQSVFLKKNFGTPEQLVATIAGAGVRPPTIHAARKWFQRGAIPTSYGYTILAVMEGQTGVPVSILPYMKKGEAQ